MTIYEVFGTKDIGSKILSLGRVFSAKDAKDAIAKAIAKYGTDKIKGEIKITDLRVWGTSDKEETSKLDPNTLCACHSTILWKCSNLLPPTVSVTSDGIKFVTGE